MELNRNLMLRTRYSLLFLFIITIFSCTGSMEKITLQIGKSIYVVEVARTPEERQKGLMDRKEIPDKTGMLFVFENDRKLTFWMKNTHVPLSIAYISSAGIIKEIHDMEPESLAPVPSVHFVRYALELPKGAFQKEGLKEGDRITLPEAISIP